MRIDSSSFEPGKPIPSEFAMGTPDGFGGNRNPQLSWEGAPDGTKSFALLCIDTDAPTDAPLANRDGFEIPVAHPRSDFAHWVMVDIPPDVRDIAAGSCSDGITKRGKQDPAGPDGAHQGLNDYTSWFKGDADMGGDYFGYDGPYPPANDLRIHRYFFRVFALGVSSLDPGSGPGQALPAKFTAGDVLRAIQGHVLAEAATYGTYSLHPDPKSHP